MPASSSNILRPRILPLTASRRRWSSSSRIRFCSCLAPCPKRVCSGRGEAALTAEPPRTNRERRENDVPDGVYTQAGFNAAR